ncbi:hypothetical protein DFH28DRAFT_890626 [Melampsora americana]|nr:hypothetical protein DFH28DRAFT_890626 [Melampsora americana]
MKRERPETPSEGAEIARLEEEVSRLKASLRALEDKILMNTTCHEVKLVYPIIEQLRREVTNLKLQFNIVDAALGDFDSTAELERQHVRAHDIAIQKIADASGNHHVDVKEEIEIYDDGRHRNYFETRDAAIVQAQDQVPVSDPHLES